MRGVLSGGLLLSSLAVAGVYHALLAATVHYEGLAVWTDLGFHTVVPLGFALMWLTEPKRVLPLAAVLPWLAMPLVYCLYALLRGALDGRYPYFFLNVPRLGVGGVALWIAALTLAFGLGALAIRAVAGLQARRGTH